MKIQQQWILIFLVVIAAFSRLIPHLPNFTALSALALFAGSYGQDKRIAYVGVFISLFISDCFLGFHSLMPVVYACLAVTVWIGNHYGHNHSAARLLPLSIVSSLLFFGVTNLGVFTLSGMYAHTPAGLAQCFIAAIPFLRNQIAGDIFYIALLWGSYSMMRLSLPTHELPINAQDPK